MRNGFGCCGPTVPVADNEAMQAEHVDKLAQLGRSQASLRSSRPTTPPRLFPKIHRRFRNLVLTGTAGEGKTSLCFELVAELTVSRPRATMASRRSQVETAKGRRTITLIYDVTAWRKRSDGHSVTRMSKCSKAWRRLRSEDSEDFFVLAVNDGQMLRAIPSSAADAPRTGPTAGEDLIDLHARNRERLRRSPTAHQSEQGSQRADHELCLAAVLDRSEWSVFRR